MEIRIAKIAASARKHRVSAARIRAAVANRVLLEGQPPNKIRIEGPDDNGIMLEIVARPAREGGWLIIHAMPLHYRRRNR